MITRDRSRRWSAAVVAIASTGLAVHSAQGEIRRRGSGSVIPGTEGITPGPGMRLSNWNTDAHNLRYADFSGPLDLSDSSFTRSWLQYALFAGADLTGAIFDLASLIGADFSRANLTGVTFDHGTLRNANLRQADLTGVNFLGRVPLSNANLTDAIVTGVSFPTDTVLTKGQLYSTASYKAHDLVGIGLLGHDLTSWDFAGQNLTGARFANATLVGVDLTDAVVAGANLGSTTDSGFTERKLFATASYKARDLVGIDLGYNDLTGWNFAEQNLTGASFRRAWLANADLTDALVSGADFEATTGFTQAQLYSTASYKDHDLVGIGLGGNDLTSWSFAGQNLTDADFEDATLANADLTDAVVTGADFEAATGFTKEQLYSTTSYRARDLVGLDLESNDLTGWNLAGQNLTGADFLSSTLTNADLSQASLTYAVFQSASLSNADLSQASLANARFYRASLFSADLSQANLTDAHFHEAILTNADLNRADTRGAEDLHSRAATTDNTILPDGRIEGLHLAAGETLTVRDYEGGIAVMVEDGLDLADGSALEMFFADDNWGSTMMLAAGFVPDLGGSLRLDFAPGTDPSVLVGTTFDLFDWNGQLVAGDEFGEVESWPDRVWDLSHLYTLGEVTLIAIPEPSAALLLLAGLALLRRQGPTRRPRLWGLNERPRAVTRASARA